MPESPTILVQIDDAKLAKQLKKIRDTDVGVSTKSGDSGGINKLSKAINELKAKLDAKLAEVTLAKSDADPDNIKKFTASFKRIDASVELYRSATERFQEAVSQFGSIFDLDVTGTQQKQEEEEESKEKEKPEEPVDESFTSKLKSVFGKLKSANKKANTSLGANKKLLGIGLGITALVAIMTKASGILQGTLSLLSTSILLIFRPIGDFIGMFLRPFVIIFYRAALPFIIEAMKWARTNAPKFAEQVIKWLEKLKSGEIWSILALLLGGVIGAFIYENYDKIEAWIKDNIIDKLKDTIINFISTITGIPADKIRETFRIILHALTTLDFSKILDTLKENLILFIAHLTGIDPEVLSAKIKEIIDKLSNLSLETIAEDIKNAFLGIISAITGIDVDDLSKTFEEFVSVISKGINAFISKFGWLLGLGEEDKIGQETKSEPIPDSAWSDHEGWESGRESRITEDEVQEHDTAFDALGRFWKSVQEAIPSFEQAWADLDEETKETKETGTKIAKAYQDVNTELDTVLTETETFSIEASSAYARAVARLRAMARSSSGGSSGSGRRFASGGIINERVEGVGLRTGDSYTFGEAGAEKVTPLKQASSGAKSKSVNVNLSPNFNINIERVSDDIDVEAMIQKVTDTVRKKMADDLLEMQRNTGIL